MSLPGEQRDLGRPAATLRLQTAEGEVAIHALQVGTVTVKTCHRELCVPEDTDVMQRFRQIFGASELSAPMPNLVYAIEHSTGTYLVDTGELARFNTDPDYYACDRGAGNLYRRLLRIGVRPDQEVDRSLSAAGVQAPVRGIVLTHLHDDH
ncbi:MAG: hypothetical protein AAFN74_25855, partial [Myxococcota bacterium]